MSVYASLHIEGHASESNGIVVIACDYRLSQDTDGRGLATSTVGGGTINVTIRGINDDELIGWMISSSELKNGRIQFTGRDANSPGWDIEFNDAFLVSYHEKYSNNSDITIDLVISARVLIFGGNSSLSFWPEE